MYLFKHTIARHIAATPLAGEAKLDVHAVAALFSPPPKADMGDLALPAFAFAKAAKVKPPEAAARLKSELEVAGTSGVFDLCAELRVTGPYLNFFLKPEALARHTIEEVNRRAPGRDPEAWRYGDNESGAGKSVVIDYSSPNIAKPLAVHHLRSTMIGASLKRIYEACGWRAIGINHLGDWGTNFGKLIAGYCETRPEVARMLENEHLSEQEVDALFRGMSVDDLNRAYVEFSARAAQDASLEDRGKEEFAALERALTEGALGQLSPHGRRNFRMWEQIKHISLAEYERVYLLLGVRFAPWPLVLPELREAYESDASAFLRRSGFYTGESYYVAASALCERVIGEAKSKGIAEISDGALVVFVDGPDKPPMMLLKDDGATGYHTRDMAAALYRREHFAMDKGLYVVDARQALHFRQLFKGLGMLGHEWAGECEHIEFGIMLGRDPETGKWGIFSTRKGKLLLLHELLSDAIAQVRAIIAEKNPALAADEGRLREISTAVGVGAIVFNDLKHGRRADVKFDWDEALSFSGETGPYMLYQYVRLGSVRRKFDERYGAKGAVQPGVPDYSRLTHPLERELLKHAAAFPEAVQRACAENEPSVISRYLLDLSSLFSSYWTATKEEGIVGDDEALSRARIALVDALRKVLGRGLTLLNLRLVEEM